MAEIQKEMGNASMKGGDVDAAAGKYAEGLRMANLVLQFHIYQLRLTGDRASPAFSGPSADSTVVSQLEQGALVRVGNQSEDGEWMQLQRPDGSGELVEAWIKIDGDGWKWEQVVPEEMQRKAEKVCVALNLNLAQVCLKQHDWAGTVAHATHALELDPDNCKALFRRAVASVNLVSKKWVMGAVGDLMNASLIDPTDRDIHDALKATRQQLREIERSWKEAEAEGWSRLMLASREQCSEEVESLLEARAEVDGLGPGGATALTLAAEAGSADLVELLLGARASVDLPGAGGATALALCAMARRRWPACCCRPAPAPAPRARQARRPCSSPRRAATSGWRGSC
ncbi:unnamed protein product [Prorocentrum cordatum]|uniref:Uncharacterized protein n=1 Tax=Prorocentrum cordatum TaxID=2364126 RepID=A0ABN9TYD2_9DINO|nr:unnamed protein product [Polarella glacialis]